MSDQYPEISVNKLGEFIYATAAKKKSILKTFKFPSTFKIARYSTPKSALVNYMIDETHDIKIFEQKRKELLVRNANTAWKQNAKQCCLQAIEDLIHCTGMHLVPYLKYTSQAGLPKPEKNRRIDKVIVHLGPDIILLDKKTKAITGAIKLVFSKSRALDFNEGVAISGVIKNHLEKLYGVSLSENNCITLDVFHRRAIPA